MATDPGQIGPSGGVAFESSHPGITVAIGADCSAVCASRNVNPRKIVVSVQVMLDDDVAVAFVLRAHDPVDVVTVHVRGWFSAWRAGEATVPADSFPSHTLDVELAIPHPPAIVVRFGGKSRASSLACPRLLALAVPALGSVSARRLAASTAASRGKATQRKNGPTRGTGAVSFRRRS